MHIKKKLILILPIIAFISFLLNMDFKNFIKFAKISISEEFNKNTKYRKEYGYDFASLVMSKYYDDDYSSPTFYFSPYELGMHILLDGYRLNNFRVQNEYLIKNHNKLIEHKEKKDEKKIIIKMSEEANIHGIFIELDKVNSKSQISINNKNIIVEKVSLINCSDLIKKPNLFYSKRKESIKKLNELKNCKYFEFKNLQDNNYTKKFKNINSIYLENINKIILYGNHLPIDSYVVIARDKENYNYFFAKKAF